MSKRERLVAAACRLFHTQGVERTTLADIAGAAGVPLGNVYYYFKTKDEIIAAVLDGHAGRIETALAALERRHRTPLSRLKALVAELASQGELVARYGCPQGTLCAELDKRDGAPQEDVARLMTLPLAWAERQFRELGRPDARDLAIQLIAAYQGAAMLTHALGDPQLMRRESRRIGRWLESRGARGPAAPRGAPLPDGVVRGEDGACRCWWAGASPEYRAYHDDEWGRPVADDVRLFEKLSLEGFQAGLSWLTILRKRDAFRQAFAGFDFERVARFGERDVTRLLADTRIVRHRGKIEAVINNARRALELARDEGSLAAYVWRFEPPERPRALDREALRTLATTPESTALARDLRARGWRFVGPTTVYAFMQAMGLVNDHVAGCDARGVVARDRAAFTRPA